MIEDHKIPFIIVFNKTDLYKISDNDITYCKQSEYLYSEVSATQKNGIDNLKKIIYDIGAKINFSKDTIIGDLISEGDIVLLVAPIDLSAPKGRLILPQVQVLRDILDNDCIAITIKEDRIIETLDSLIRRPKLVITDSQAIECVNNALPKNQDFTTFSILFARYKGEIESLIEGAKSIDNLKNKSKILIAEACSHHVQSDDIGRYKLPQWLRDYTNKELDFTFYAGNDYPDNLKDFDLIVHCGGCMFNRREMCRRIEIASDSGVPITNYGLTIAKTHGILERAIKPIRV